jgi:dsDNA-specific endonuclease/ATPase MutS2
MCKSISTHREDIKTAVAAIAELDGYRAKAILGKRLRGTIPEVSVLKV